METTESKAILSLLGYMYFADISIVNSGVREAYAHVYHLVYCVKLIPRRAVKSSCSIIIEYTYLCHC